jgi:sugar/nucleoside kinase (ribokinase family)
MSEYLKSIKEILERIEEGEARSLDKAAEAVSDVICRDGIIHVFGCGHSHLAAAEIAKRYGVKVIFNPAPARKLPKAIIEAVSLFTPNEFEAEALGEVPCEVVTTLGAKGCKIRSTGEVVPTPSVKAVDSTGAGDTFNAVLAVRLAEEEGLRDACAAANEAASRSVAVRYVMPSLPRRVIYSLKSDLTKGNRRC